MADKGGKSKKQQDSKKGRPSGAGRRKGKFDRFFSHTAEHKLHHVLKRNGAMAAKAFVGSGYVSSGVLHKISKEQTRAGDVARKAFGA